MARITALNIYPVKGARGVALEAADVSTAGLAGDRVFTVLQDGARTNQKQIADLKFLSATWEGDALRLGYPERPDFVLDTRQHSGTLEEAFRGRQVPLADMGDAVADWLSATFASNVRLVRCRESTPWVIPLPEFSLVDGKPQDRFVDAAPLLVTADESLADLNARLDAPVPMDRFRPNIVIDGVDPYAEEAIGALAFPGAMIRNVTVCERCIVTTMDQQSGTIGKEPLHTLSKYHKRTDDYAGGIIFGIYATADGNGVLKVGDEAPGQ